MSRSDDTTEDSRRGTGTENRGIKGMFRRLAVQVTRTAFWQLAGVLLLDQRTRETTEAEVFSGVGFYSRPKQGANAEAIVGHVGGAENPVIIATRDEDTRKRVAKIDQDETAAYNTVAIMLIKKNGTIELRLAAGVAQKTILGETYRAAEDTLLTALGVFATAIGALNPVTAAGAATTLNTAITNFQTASAAYLSSVAKVQ